MERNEPGMGPLELVPLPMSINLDEDVLEINVPLENTGEK